MPDLHRWADTIVASLWRAGVRHLCIAPGSRSAPLIGALSRARVHAPFQLHTHIDERGLGFFALGLSRQSGEPVAVIVTSGTAVANLHPAVVEAFESGLPLVVCSADRPQRLLHCGANQAIDQRHLFGRHVVAEASLPAPVSESEHPERLAQLANLLAQRHGPGRGPVHLNLPFDEPLYDFSVAPVEAPLAVIEPLPAALGPEVDALPRLDTDTLLIAGELAPEEAAAVLALAEHTGLPVVADINSQLRLRSHPNIMVDGDLRARQGLLPPVSRVVQFGGRLVSKFVYRWLEQLQPEYWLFHDRQCNLDPTGNARQQCAKLVTLCRQLGEEHAQPRNAQSLSAALNGPSLPGMDDWSELSLCRELPALIEGRADLFIGNSLAIRWCDTLALPVADPPTVFSNRGASGIDGLLATAAGIAVANQRSLVALLGDSSLLHDLNSLLLLAQQQVPLVVVVINNDGGNIFDLLPARTHETLLQDYFRCPHGMNLSEISGSFGLSCQRVQKPAEFRQALTQTLASGGPAVVECVFPPGEATARFRSLLQALAKPAQD